MKKQKSPYEGNKRIMEDEATYPDKNTIVLIDLITDIVVRSTLTQLDKKESEMSKITPPKTASDP